MVKLPSKEILNRSNINSVERAIIFSATLLKAIYTKHTINTNPSTKTDKTFQITHTTNNKGINNLIIQANLPFDNISALTHGGRVLDNLIILDVNELPEILYSCPDNSTHQANLPINIPIEVVTLEQYFYYHASLLKTLETEDQNNIEIKFLADSDLGGIINLKVILPFDYIDWIKGSNYVCSAKNIGENTIDFTNYSDIFISSQSIDQI